MPTIRDIQAALQQRGYDPKGVDGVWGRNSAAALRAFQQAAGLPATGVADSASVRALIPTAQNAPPPPWYGELLRFQGLREGAGARDNPTILGWAKALGGFVARFYQHDSIAWCGLTVAHCLAVTLPHEPLPNNPLGALSYRTFGRALEAPALGAVLVFTRPGAPGSGHVGFYAGEDADRYYVLGGNQRDSVCIVPVAKARCVAVRWPVTAPPPEGGRILLSSAQAASSNEA